mmetsp:Transcript_56100/g.125242  ORF Transcript_56100/g.125242 Transcript_56100/m.125242 type:complete len:374 (-) Transcript_56100:224-1345(-)
MPENFHLTLRHMRRPVSRCRSVPTEPSCSSRIAPGDVAFAINTGDSVAHTSRVKALLSTWPADVPVVVFSSTISGETWGPARVYPCCRGVDYSGSIGSAQRMREHTWPLMASQFPKARWYVSTEDDVWWNVSGLHMLLQNITCSSRERAAIRGRVHPEEDVTPFEFQVAGGCGGSRSRYLSLASSVALVGGGSAGLGPVRVNGPFVVMTRSLLALFANQSVLSGCRQALVQALRNGDLSLVDASATVYPGAEYNSDHLISYCALTYFPRALRLPVVSYVDHAEWQTGGYVYARSGDKLVSMAKRKRPNRPPRYFYQNGHPSWRSVRAAKLYHTHPGLLRERIVAFHHAQLEDIRFLNELNAHQRAMTSLGRLG